MKDPINSKEEENPFYPYLNQAHKDWVEKATKELEEQDKLQLNSKEEVKKHLEMHERIARKYPNKS